MAMARLRVKLTVRLTEKRLVEEQEARVPVLEARVLPQVLPVHHKPMELRDSTIRSPLPTCSAVHGWCNNMDNPREY